MLFSEVQSKLYSPVQYSCPHITRDDSANLNFRQSTERISLVNLSKRPVSLSKIRSIDLNRNFTFTKPSGALCALYDKGS